jgi:hypothetical protein
MDLKCRRRGFQSCRAVPTALGANPLFLRYPTTPALSLGLIGRSKQQAHVEFFDGALGRPLILFRTVEFANSKWRNDFFVLYNVRGKKILFLYFKFSVIRFW